MLTEPIQALPRSVNPLAMNFQNACFVDSNDDLAAKYDWLKSSDRDAKMGALSVTNRRTLVLSPGSYELTSMWTVDTDYVDIVSFGVNPAGTLVYGSIGGSNIVAQTCNALVMRGFTIRQNNTTSYSFGLKVIPDAGNNADSYYLDMHFRRAGGSSTQVPVAGEDELNGTWVNCESDDRGWVICNIGGDGLSATMFNCIGGDNAYGGDGTYRSGGPYAVEITGTFFNCTSGEQSFGGCLGAGCKITSTAKFYNCDAGDRSYALGKECAGSFYNCTGLLNCFGGSSSITGSGAGSFTGLAINCRTTGGFSFGMGDIDNVQSGKLINCSNGDTGGFLSNISGTTATKASLTTSIAGANNDLIWTARYAGAYGNNISVIYVTSKGVTAVDLKIDDDSYTAAYVIQVGYAAGETAGGIITAIRAEDSLNAFVAVENAGGDNGSGTMVDMAETALTGGVDGPVFKGNFDVAVCICTLDTPVFAFSSGMTYTNEGAAAAITFPLPVAKIGLKYSFVVKTAQELRLDPDGTETIALANGTQQAAGLYITANAVGERCSIECVKDGEWEHSDSIGTWAVEA